MLKEYINALQVLSAKPKPEGEKPIMDIIIWSFYITVEFGLPSD